ncbi:MAG: hypothetical protein LUO94_13695, partial [Methylococcaceae bacterium]|nr:hypothetical protein [Methylococcaceae bacterium]
PAEIKALLSELRGNFNNERLESFIAKTQHDLLQSIVVPFGLGKLLSAYDKTGGNVDTIYNVRTGIYATDEEKAAYNKEVATYEENSKYYSDAVYKDKNYKDRGKEIHKARESNGVQDSYSDKIMWNHKELNIDHVISLKQTHHDAGRVLADVKTEDLSNIPENLTPTSESANKSKNSKSPEQFASHLEEKALDRQARIQVLNEKSSLTDIENKELKKLNTLENVDPDRVREKGRIAQEAQDKRVNGEYYSSEKFLTNTVGTSAMEGVKMGAQQAFGVLLIELFTASFNEIRAAFNEGLEGESLLDDICIRLKRIGKNISTKWKDFFEGFCAGLISGFISNIVTVMINVFATTSKRLVRMIREGIFSLLKALKMLLAPPQGITYREAAHEAMKLLVAGGFIATGVVLEEFVEKLILSIPFLIPIAHIVTAVIVGAITVIVTALFIYLIDQLDLLNVIKIGKDKYIIENLDNDIKSKLQGCERIGMQLDDYLDFTDTVSAT